jgi:hypothetical protein
MRLDHLAFTGADLETAAAAAEAALGLALQPGGEHAAMGTHNRLLSLGPDCYFEVIAINPAAPPPRRPRWFDIDRFSGPPRLTNWICACDDLDAMVARFPGAGRPMAFARGEFRWRMAVPEDGILPFDGAFPALIQWEGPAHPAPRLADRGARLAALTVSHPRAPLLRDMLAPLIDDARLSFATGPRALEARIDTPAGQEVLR